LRFKTSIHTSGLSIHPSIITTRSLSRNHNWRQHCQGTYHPGSPRWKESLEVSRRVLQGRRVSLWSEMREKGSPIAAWNGFRKELAGCHSTLLARGPWSPHKERRHGFDGNNNRPLCPGRCEERLPSRSTGVHGQAFAYEVQVGTALGHKYSAVSAS
jgi:hypothetical protein